MTYENQAQVEAHESPRGRRLPWQLRCATKRDDEQMPSASDERHVDLQRRWPVYRPRPIMDMTTSRHSKHIGPYGKTNDMGKHAPLAT
jgi:hypothetical protein